MSSILAKEFQKGFGKKEVLVVEKESGNIPTVSGMLYSSGFQGLWSQNIFIC